MEDEIVRPPGANAGSEGLWLGARGGRIPEPEVERPQGLM